MTIVGWLVSVRTAIVEGRSFLDMVVLISLLVIVPHVIEERVEARQRTSDVFRYNVNGIGAIVLVMVLVGWLMIELSPSPYEPSYPPLLLTLVAMLTALSCGLLWWDQALSIPVSKISLQFRKPLQIRCVRWTELEAVEIMIRGGIRGLSGLYRGPTWRRSVYLRLKGRESDGASFAMRCNVSRLRYGHDFLSLLRQYGSHARWVIKPLCAPDRVVDPKTLELPV